MKIDELNPKHLVAEPEKVLRRLSDGWIAGSEIYLGYTYRVGGEPLDIPLLELPEHYEEIDAPVPDEPVIEEVLSPADETQLAEPDPEPVEQTPDPRTYEQRIVQMIRTRYSLSDELAILRQRDSKPDEFDAYFAFCEECKQTVKQQLSENR